MNASDPGPLPNFLIVGAMKAGTTSLSAWLREHPDVFIPPEKELHFFDDPARYERGIDWYRSQFAPGAGRTAIGEATPGYMARPQSMKRIAEAVPGIRLMAILRHPVDRFQSQYQHLRGLGRDTRPLSRVVDAELSGTAPPLGFYFERGRYLEHIRRLHELFPPSSLKLMLFDDLTSDPAGVYVDACRYLGVDEAYRPENLGVAYNPRRRLRSRWLRRATIRARKKRRISTAMAARIDAFNVRRDPDRYEPMDPELRARLVQAYADQIPELEKLLGRDLSSWRR